MAGSTLTQDAEMAAAACEFKGPDLYRGGIFKIVQRWNKCINMAGGWVEKLLYTYTLTM